jgi:hypothetical protein
MPLSIVLDLCQFNMQHASEALSALRQIELSMQLGESFRSRHTRASREKRVGTGKSNSSKKRTAVCVWQWLGGATGRFDSLIE